jgi:hypothetical protein
MSISCFLAETFQSTLSSPLSSKMFTRCWISNWCKYVWLAYFQYIFWLAVILLKVLCNKNYCQNCEEYILEQKYTFHHPVLACFCWLCSTSTNQQKYSYVNVSCLANITSLQQLGLSCNPSLSQFCAMLYLFYLCQCSEMVNVSHRKMANKPKLGCVEMTIDIVYCMNVCPPSFCSTTEPWKQKLSLFLQSVIYSNLVSMNALRLCLAFDTPGHISVYSVCDHNVL